MDKKVGLANVLLKGAIIGIGTLGGLALSRLFRVEAEDSGGSGMSVADDSIDVPFEEVKEVTTEET